MSYASEKRAPGICDRCGFRYPLKTLKAESVAGRLKKNRVCPSCFDVDHPQNFIGRVRVFDPQGLQAPRPDPSLDQIRSLPGWNPVGNGAIRISAQVGQVSVRVT